MLAGACAPGEAAAATRELYELERLAFVPPVPFKLVLGARNDSDGDCSIKRAIVMDRFEFTRRDLRHYWGDRVRVADHVDWSEELAGYTEDRLDWPAYMSYYEAEELATRRGMRIPFAKEWIHVAVGRKRMRYPWGSKAGRFANTIDISVNRPVPVGTFENGRVDLFGCYDMLGNVWEWVADEVRSFRTYFKDVFGEHTSVMGGGYESTLARVYLLVGRNLAFNARRVRKGTLNPAYGARMCADAGPYLWKQAFRWGSGDEARRRVIGVARRWAEDSVARDALRSLLSELLERPGAPEGLFWLREGLFDPDSRS
jgi:hypothetical protein